MLVVIRVLAEFVDPGRILMLMSATGLLAEAKAADENISSITRRLDVQSHLAIAVA